MLVFSLSSRAHHDDTILECYSFFGDIVIGEALEIQVGIEESDRGSGGFRSMPIGSLIELQNWPHSLRLIRRGGLTNANWFFRTN